MSKDNHEFPFQTLGESLRKMRQKRRASLAEVSGAVEIEVESLDAIEQGTDRPGKDILLLLISYFDIKEEDAVKLWELAGYNKRDMQADPFAATQPETQQPAVMVMPMDARIAYTDMAHVMVNDYGVVINFMQGAGPNNQPLAVARVGMSREHAKSVLELLQRTLGETERKILPSPEAQVQDVEEADTSN